MDLHTAATMSDPDHTPHGAVYPSVSLQPVAGCVVLHVHRPEGSNGPLAFTKAELHSLRDDLTMILEDFI